MPKDTRVTIIIPCLNEESVIGSVIDDCWIGIKAANVTGQILIVDSSTDRSPGFQSGAWQVGLRYSYIDLNDGPIRGGQLNDVTAGLNWFLNPNFKIQGNYSYGYRTVDAASNGSYHGFGVRFAFDW